jgi:hypothetical protein
VVVALAIIRNLTALHEDDNLHLNEGEQRKQIVFLNMMDRIDGWGKTLTVITTVSGLLLASIYIYRSIAIRL